MAIVGAREKKAETVYAIDLIPERLKAAERFGAIPIDLTRENPLQRIREQTQGRGADSVLELVGNESSERLAFELVRPGGVLAVAGVHTATHFTFSPPEAYGKNLTYRVGRCPARAYMERLVPLVQSKKYDLAALFSHRLPLASGGEGYQLFAHKREGCTKVLLEVR